MLITDDGQKLLYVLLTLSVINLHITHYNKTNIHFTRLMSVILSSNIYLLYM